jgi:hypothetical protein
LKAVTEMGTNLDSRHLESRVGLEGRGELKSRRVLERLSYKSQSQGCDPNYTTVKDGNVSNEVGTDPLC